MMQVSPGHAWGPRPSPSRLRRTSGLTSKSSCQWSGSRARTPAPARDQTCRGRGQGCRAGPRLPSRRYSYPGSRLRLRLIRCTGSLSSIFMAPWHRHGDGTVTLSCWAARPRRTRTGASPGLTMMIRGGRRLSMAKITHFCTNLKFGRTEIAPIFRGYKGIAGYSVRALRPSLH